MYFTDKFARSDLKLFHPGLMKTSPGRKQPEVHKNATSSDYMFLSKVYSEKAFTNPLPTYYENPSSTSIKELTSLQLEINEKNKKIKDMEKLLSMKLQNEAKQLGLPGLKLSQHEFYTEYSKDLQSQIKEHDNAKSRQKLIKEAEAQKRMQDLKKLKEAELRERKIMTEKAEAYKSVLESQKDLRRSLEYSQSTLFPALRNSSQKINPSLTKFIEIPERRNNNSLTISLSTLPQFSQTRYTRNHPKLVHSNPILQDE